MGFIGYTVKLVFIPINNIIVGGSWAPRAVEKCGGMQKLRDSDGTVAPSLGEMALRAVSRAADWLFIPSCAPKLILFLSDFLVAS